ncbi:MAG: autotransporter outer membrane beta-barrel domain-containing protein [Hyphomonadaceae bacterium]
MRIRRKIELAGLAVALAGGVSGTAEAGDRTISTPITTPVSTSNPDGTAVPGDIEVTSAGSITVTAGQTAITVDSSNDVLVDGQIAATDANNVTGISILGGNVGPNTIEIGGAINLLEDYTISDSDSDGDLDGDLALGTDRHGIFLQAGPTFTGDIINSGSIFVEGNNSSAITLDTLLTGDLVSSGGLNVIGEDSYGIAINGGVTGDVLISGGATVRGQNSVGVHVNGDVGGQLSISGTYNVTGYLQTAGISDQGALDPDDLEQSGSAILVNGNVAGGITIEGIGVENDEDDDGDTELNEADDNAGAVINQFGSAPAVNIAADGSNIVIGPGAEGYGLLLRGSIAAFGIWDGVGATGLRIAGDGGGSTTTINGGISLDSAINANASGADAQAILIGQDAITPFLQVRGSVIASVNSDPAFTVYGILVESGADVASFNNSGNITATYFGETGDSVAVSDQSGTLTSITNSGQIIAQIAATDDDLTDDIPPPPITGSAIAFDLSATSANISFQQVEPTVFTDDDAIDNFLAAPARIVGDILFGSGNDTLDLLSGTIAGNVAFGAGADAFNIDNGAIYTGSLSDADGQLVIDVADGVLNYQGGTLTITSANFSANSAFNPLLSDVPGETTNITATGSVTFAAGAQLTPVLPAGLPTFGTQTFLSANQMFGAANVIGLVGGANAPFLYDIIIDTTNPIVEGGANSLNVTFDLKTPAELGLSTNQAIAFDPILAALRLDTDAAAAMAAITTEYEFFDAYEDLLPNYAEGATEIAATAIQQMQSATSNRMAATRLQGLNEVSVWGQEIAYGIDREPPNSNAQAFRGHGFGFAGGIDGPTNNGAMFGLSVSFIASEVEEPGRPEGEIAGWFGQANAYYATAMGPIDLDFIAGLGAGKMQSRRFVEIGNPVAFSALTEADWLAFEGHGSIRASAPMAISDAFTVTPQAALTYVGISEQDYEEEGGGPAIDYAVDGVFSQRLWADVGIEFAANMRFGERTIVSPRIYAGYRANVLDAESERTVQFVSGGAPFTLTDEGVGDGAPLIGIGFDASNGYSTFSLGYEGEFGDQIERHSINAAIRFRF